MLKTHSLVLFFALSAGLSGCQQFEQIPFVTGENDDFLVDAIAANDGTTTSAISLREFEIDDTSDASALRFAKDDEIKIGFWGHEELDHVATVQGNGRITVPLVGEVIAENRTADQIKAEITRRLEQLADAPHPILRPGDKASLFVWQNEDLNMTSIVQPDGTVTFPLVGRIQVTDRQVEDVEVEIRDRLAQYINEPNAWFIPELQERKVILDPQVSVLPLTIQSRQVSVLGEIAIPGVQPLRGGMRIMESLAAAQITTSAEWDSIIVIRRYDSQEPSYRRLRLGEFLTGMSPEQNIVLQDGDIIMVPRTKIAQVGLFIDQFFSKTRPLFDWWLVGHQAYRYDEIVRLNQAVNRAAKTAFEKSAANPTVIQP
jgi:protein involved in polysaccharide export with SLBB domain